MRTGFGLIFDRDIGAALRDELDRLGIASSWSIDASAKRRIDASDMPGPVRLLLSIGSTALVTPAACAMADLAAGYHPSLLPRHPGRHAVRETIAAGDRVAGGSLYILSPRWDAGVVLAQDDCPVLPGETPRDLWQRALLPIGVRLSARLIAANFGNIGA